MAKKFSAGARRKLDVLEEASRKMDRVHSLVEQYAAAKGGADHLLMSMAHASKTLARLLLIGGFGAIADTLNGIATLARRGGSQQTKARNLRELVASGQAAIERAVKSVMTGEKKLALEAQEDH
ncbi:MAG: hypothetical protein ACE5FJ_08475 [Gemmatimonadales bacterium]